MICYGFCLLVSQFLCVFLSFFGVIFLLDFFLFFFLCSGLFLLINFCWNITCLCCLANVPSCLQACGTLNVRFRYYFQTISYRGATALCVAVAIILYARIALPVLWEFFACLLIACLLFGDHIFSPIRST